MGGNPYKWIEKEEGSADPTEGRPKRVAADKVGDLVGKNGADIFTGGIPNKARGKNQSRLAQGDEHRRFDEIGLSNR